jgi:hypothetical protein
MPVSVLNYNFTTPIDKNLYVVLLAQEGAKNGDFKATIRFEYYEYDPGCPKFTYWNGTDCQNNYTEYCPSLTE